jgi:hypothetical protein
MSDIYSNYNLKTYLLIYITPIECAFKNCQVSKVTNMNPIFSLIAIVKCSTVIYKNNVINILNQFKIQFKFQFNKLKLKA